MVPISGKLMVENELSWKIWDDWQMGLPFLPKHGLVATRLWAQNEYFDKNRLVATCAWDGWIFFHISDSWSFCD